MKSNRLLIVAVACLCAGLFAACAATAPKELVSARQAYQRASAGIAAQKAPAELHVASQALDAAEQSFQENSDSYQTRDLAYVALRKAEIAEATAFIAIAQKDQTNARNDYQTAQGNIAAAAKQDLTDTKTALAASKHSGEMAAQRLSSEQQARVAAEAASSELAASEAQRLSAEQEARMAADKRAADAEAELAKLAAVKEEARGLVITLSGSVLFASNKAILLPAARSRLDKVADVLLTNSGRNLTIEGHADSRGTDSYNLDLSQRRADAVRNYLVQRGYKADLIQAHGLGEALPIADNASAEGRANNRRVEIIVDRAKQASNQ